MKKRIMGVLLLFAIHWERESSCAESRFEKVSDHCFYMQLKESGDSVGIVVAEEGILMVNPPVDSELTDVVEALKRVSTKPVRWVASTDPQYARSSGARYYAERGAQLVASSRLHNLMLTAMTAASQEAPRAGPEKKTSGVETFPLPWLVFDRQMHLFPANFEIRIYSLQHKAYSGGDVIVYVPSEKVLFVGNLCEAAGFPILNTALEGSALGWIDGMKQAIDFVPVLKSAIPQVKPEPKLELKPEAKPESKPEQEKKLEEWISVVTARGAVSNLLKMKELLEAAQKLRSDILRAIRIGRSRNSFLSLSDSEPYRSYANFESFAEQLFGDLLKNR
jgi:hypothetical protein